MIEYKFIRLKKEVYELLIKKIKEIKKEDLKISSHSDGVLAVLERAK